MNSIVKFMVRASPHGGFTTSPVFQEAVTYDEFIADYAARTGQTPALAAIMARAFCEICIDAALATRRVLPVAGLLGTQPTTGGHHDTNDFPGTLDNLNFGLALLVGKEGWSRIAANFASERQGEVGLLAPYLDTVTDTATGSEDYYTPAKQMAIHGTNLRLDPLDETQGIFFEPWAGGALVRVAATDYGVIEPSRLVFIVPAGLTGGQRLIIKTKIKGSLRSFTYMTELQHG